MSVCENDEDATEEKANQTIPPSNPLSPQEKASGQDKIRRENRKINTPLVDNEAFRGKKKNHDNGEDSEKRTKAHKKKAQQIHFIGLYRSLCRVAYTTFCLIECLNSSPAPLKID